MINYKLHIVSLRMATYNASTNAYYFFLLLWNAHMLNVFTLLVFY
jgi:hypothetical protein